MAARTRATQNSATRGAPGPAMASSPSVPGTVAASSREEAGCRSAQSTARVNLRISRSLMPSWVEEMAASSPAAGAGLSRCSVVAAMDQSKHSPPTVQRPRSRCPQGLGGGRVSIGSLALAPRPPIFVGRVAREETSARIKYHPQGLVGIGSCRSKRHGARPGNVVVPFPAMGPFMAPSGGWTRRLAAIAPATRRSSST